MDAAPPPPPYSLPWQLRPAIAVTAVRADSDFARYEDAASNHGLTVAATLTAGYRIPGTGDAGQGLVPFARLTTVSDSPPTGQGGTVIVNPLFGVEYAWAVAERVRAAVYMATTIPVGAGGGDSPDPALAAVRSHGQYARAQMDDAVFAVNDVSAIPGVDIAYVAGGLTMQVEVTVAQLWRERGAAVQPEASKTNFTTGLHVGYFVLPQLSFGAELHYQRWLDPPIAIEHDPTGTLVDNWTFAAGPRLHLKVAQGVWLRPGIAFERGLDRPMAAATPNYNIVLVDLPVVFP